MSPADDPKTFADLMAYIEKHCASIIVRDFVNGVPGRYTLVELPVARALHHAFSWLAQGIIPARQVMGDQAPADAEVPQLSDRPETAEISK
jgi:hypothetical protein